MTQCLGIELSPGRIRSLASEVKALGVEVLSLPAGDLAATADGLAEVLESTSESEQINLAQAEDLVRVEHLFGPGLVRAQAELNLTAVEGLLRTAPERFRAELHVLAGRTAELAGWIAQDSGDIANAEQLTSRAADHLLDSEPAIRAMVLMRRSNVLLQVDPERAEGLIVAAERLISGRPVGLLEASIARQRALVAAAKRDRNAFVGFASRALELAGADQADGDLVARA